MKAIANLICSISLLGALPLVAQQFSIGPALGLNGLQLQGSPALHDQEPGFGWTIGATSQFQFNDYVFYGFGLQYSRGSFATREYDSHMTPEVVEDRQYFLNYLSFPVSVGITNPGDIAPFGRIGVVSSLLLSASKSVQPPDRFPIESKMDVGEEVNPYDCTVFFDFGLRFKLNEKSTLHLAGRYQNSLTLLLASFEDPPVPLYGDKYYGQLRGFAIQLELLYSFGELNW